MDNSNLHIIENVKIILGTSSLAFLTVGQCQAGDCSFLMVGAMSQVVGMASSYRCK
jgi:hypothetical protein